MMESRIRRVIAKAVSRMDRAETPLECVRFKCSKVAWENS